MNYLSPSLNPSQVQSQDVIGLLHIDHSSQTILVLHTGNGHIQPQDNSLFDHYQELSTLDNRSFTSTIA